MLLKFCNIHWKTRNIEETNTGASLGILQNFKSFKEHLRTAASEAFNVDNINTHFDLLLSVVHVTIDRSMFFRINFFQIFQQ